LIIYARKENWEFDKEPKTYYTEEEKRELEERVLKSRENLAEMEGEVPLDEFLEVRKTYEEMEIDGDKLAEERKKMHLRSYKADQIIWRDVSKIGKTHKEFSDNLREHVDGCVACCRKYLTFLLSDVESQQESRSEEFDAFYGKMSIAEYIKDKDEYCLRLLSIKKSKKPSTPTED